MKRGGLNDEQYAALVQRSLEVTHPLFQSRGRAPDPSEVADLIAFLDLIALLLEPLD